MRLEIREVLSSVSEEERSNRRIGEVGEHNSPHTAVHACKFAVVLVSFRGLEGCSYIPQIMYLSIINDLAFTVPDRGAVQAWFCRHWEIYATERNEQRQGSKVDIEAGI